MSIHKCLSIAALMVCCTVLLFIPPPDSMAGSPQAVQGQVGTYWCPCGPNCPPPPLLNNLGVDSFSAMPAPPMVEKGICIHGCMEIYGEASHTFTVAPNALFTMVGETNNVCLGMDFRINPNISCISTPFASATYLLAWKWECTAPESGEIVVTVHGIGDYRITVAEAAESTTREAETLAGLQRFNEPASTPYIMYVPTAERAAAEDTQFIDIWRLDDNGIGQPLLYIAKEALLALPEYPAENLLIATSSDELVNVYKLTTGEYQVNIGPLADGKVYTTIFDAIPPTQVTHSTWVVPSE